MNSRRRRGFEAERELVRKLWKCGFAAIRGPASGSKIKKGVYPDVVALYRGRIFVFEVKSRSKLTTVYLDNEQVEKLRIFSERAGGIPLIALKIRALRVWKIIPLEHVVCRETRCSIPRDVIETSTDLDTFIKKILTKPLDEFVSDASRGA